ncbi:MAG: ABC transporter substrate-binding protein [Solirubrobacterales bacterium]
MRCSSSSTRSSCSRSEPPPRRPPRARRRLRAPALAVAVAASFLPLAGCGPDPQSGSAGRTAAPEPGGTLTVAVADQVGTLDPLRVDDRSERLASRQVFEPLRTWQTGPFGDTRRRPGVARSIRPSPDETAWTVTLRHGVSFQNGEPLDADAVLLNVDRWTSSPLGRTLLPGLTAADSPRPGRVRFILDRPVAGFATDLADPHLGLVAPGPLIGLGGGSLRLDAAGTGPFEFRGREGGSVLLARNAEWWGTDLGLGPGIDQVELGPEPDAGNRLAALRSGTVEIADDLARGAARRIAAAPLLTTVRGSAAVVGIERSVRGIDSAAAAQSLADVWLTDLR